MKGCMGCGVGLRIDQNIFCSKSCEYAVVGWEQWQKTDIHVNIARYKLKKWGY